MRREGASVRGREVREPKQHPFDVARRSSRERGEEVAGIAPDATHARHGLKMARVEGDAHVPRLSAPVVSVVVPTYNEAAALPLLVARLAQAMGDRAWELVVVDDGSPDGTADIAQSLAATYPVRVVRRAGKAGLASAVLAGFGAATGDVLVVMDADLSHPPETVPALLDAIEAGADLAVGSRYVKGGGTMDWPLRRRVVSRAACLMGNVLVPVRDCTSGFFALRRAVVEGVRINAIGFKIGFEVIARGRYRTVVEVPYTFRDRELGASKFGRREVRLYGIQLLQVARDRLLGRLGR